MQFEFLSYNNQRNLIADVVMHKLIIHRDKRGLLFETLREDWQEVFHRPNLQFGQSYYSVTKPGFSRDETQWHVHQTKQTDRRNPPRHAESRRIIREAGPERMAANLARAVNQRINRTT